MCAAPTPSQRAARVHGRGRELRLADEDTADVGPVAAGPRVFVARATNGTGEGAQAAQAGGTLCQRARRRQPSAASERASELRRDPGHARFPSAGGARRRRGLRARVGGRRPRDSSLARSLSRAARRQPVGAPRLAERATGGCNAGSHAGFSGVGGPRATAGRRHTRRGCAADGGAWAQRRPTARLAGARRMRARPHLGRRERRPPITPALPVSPNFSAFQQQVTLSIGRQQSSSCWLEIR